MVRFNLMKCTSLLVLILPVLAFAAELGQNSSSSEEYSDDWTQEQSEAWKKANIQMAEVDREGASHGDPCQRKWDIVWPLAKAENPAARYFLYKRIDEGYGFYFQGQGFNLLSRPRVRSMLYFHSLGAPEMKRDIDNVMTHHASLEASYPELASLGYPEIKRCILYTPSQECTKMLIYRGGIFPFSRFANELDFLLGAGLSVRCSARIAQ